MALLLDLLGWNRVDHETEDLIRSNKKLILVYNHTSVVDYIMYLLHRNAYPELQTRSRVIMNHDVYHSIGPLSRSFGAIPSTSKSGGGSGTLETIYQELSKMDEFLYIVSPKGSTRINAHWHRGYYVLAKRLGCKIAAGGFDYEKRCFVIKEPFYVGDQTFDEVTFKCQRQLEDIIPVCPWRAEYPLDIYGERVLPSQDRQNQYHIMDPRSADYVPAYASTVSTHVVTLTDSDPEDIPTGSPDHLDLLETSWTQKRELVPNSPTPEEVDAYHASESMMFRRAVSGNDSPSRESSSTHVDSTYSSVCGREPGGVTDGDRIQGAFLYPPPSVHCEIFSIMLRILFPNDPSCILDHKDEWLVGHLQSLRPVLASLGYGSHSGLIRVQDLCCKEQVRCMYNILNSAYANPIFLAKMMESCGSYTGTDYRSGKIFKSVTTMIETEYKRHGYEYNYFCFTNVNHPFHLAATGKIPLNAATFETALPARSLSWSEKMHKSLKSVTGVDSLRETIHEVRYWDEANEEGDVRNIDVYMMNKCWSKKTLAKVILESAMNGVGSSVISKEVRDTHLRQVLSLQNITGIPAHRNIVIPGIGLTSLSYEEMGGLRKNGDWVPFNMSKRWACRENVSKIWLLHVARTLFGTAWCIPPSIIEKQTPQTMEYVYSFLLNIPFDSTKDWTSDVLGNVNNPHSFRGTPVIKSPEIKWFLNCEGFYTPIIDISGHYMVVSGYNTSMDGLRKRILSGSFLSGLKVEVILYLISCARGSGLSMEELIMDRDSAIEVLLRLMITGSTDSQKTEHEKEMEKRKEVQETVSKYVKIRRFHFDIQDDDDLWS